MLSGEHLHLVMRLLHQSSILNSHSKPDTSSSQCSKMAPRAVCKSARLQQLLYSTNFNNLTEKVQNSSTAAPQSAAQTAAPQRGVREILLTSHHVTVIKVSMRTLNNQDFPLNFSRALSFITIQLICLLSFLSLPKKVQICMKRYPAGLSELVQCWSSVLL